MKTNPNQMPKHEVSPQQLDALFARSTAQAVADRDARQRLAEWPAQVDGMLAVLARELVALRRRIDALETKMGFAGG